MTSFSNDERPVTPFLVVPESFDDDGTRPRPGAGWIWSQSTMLLDASGKLETAPSPGQSYRMLVLIENFGAAPIENGYAEFWLAPQPPVVRTSPAPAFTYEQRPVVEDATWVSLGVSTFSIPNSIGNRGEIAWALSPRTWTATDLGPCAIVRVYDPMLDGPAADPASWSNRKIAYRALNPDFTGTWVGTEINETTGAVLGPVELVMTANMQIVPKGRSHAFTPNCGIEFRRLPSLPGGALGSVQSSMIGALYFTYQTQDVPRRALHMVFTFNGNGSLTMKASNDDGSVKSAAILSNTAKKPASFDADRNLLGRVKQSIAPWWSEKRKKDAAVVYSAIASLTP